MTEVLSSPRNATSAAGRYTVEAPGVLRSNASYNVAVTILQAVEPAAVKLILVGESLREEKTLQMQPMSTQLVTFEIPDLNPRGEYYLEAEGTGGLEFKDKIKLRCALSKPLVYIQLDKQAYKCEDKVDYRVIFLDTNIRPAKLKAPFKILIKHEDEIITEVTKIELNEGVYTGQWKIPAASSGNYSVVVCEADDAIAQKEFQIIEQSPPPNFEVTIKTVKEVPYEQGQFHVAVQARHSDGTPVKGLCTMIIDAVGGYFGSGARPIEKSVEINGETDYFILNFLEDLHIEEDFQKEAYFTNVSFKLQVIVQEEGTQFEEQITELLMITKTTWNDDEQGACWGGGSCCDAADHSSHNAEGPISIQRKTETIKIGDDMEFSVHFAQATNYFVYFFIARGNIVKCELVPVENHNEPYNITVKATVNFMPRAFLLVYFIKDGQLHFDEIGFNLSTEYENQLELVAPASAQVSDVVQFEVKSSPHSLIGLMAVDEQSVVLKATNELDYYDVFKQLRYVRSQTPWLNGYGNYPGLKAGLVTFTNATWEGFTEDDPTGTCQNFSDREHLTLNCPNRCFDVDYKKKKLLRKLQERDQVYGNWFFVNLEADELGNLKFEKQLPSNPTTWIVSAFALSARTGWTLMKAPFKIQANPSTAIDDNQLPHITRTISDLLNFEVHHYEDREFRETIVLKTANAIEPVAVEFTISANLLGPTIANLSAYAGIMYCTGHLHMTTLIPNVVVLEYLESMQQLDSELASSIKSRLTEAIERELAESKADGSFVWFSKNDKGSPHVTTLVLQAFQRAAKFVHLDADIISKGLNYLASLQTEAGDFVREDEAYKQPFQDDSTVGLTALILLSFLQNENNTQIYKQTVDKALDYISGQVEHVEGIYDLAIICYALQLAKHSLAGQVKARLLRLACKDPAKNLTWWTYTGNCNATDEYPPIQKMEITAYALLALLESEPLEELLPIVKFLLPWGRHFGGFSNESMDCAMGLDAVLQFAVKSGAPLGISRIGYAAITDGERSPGEILLTPENCEKITTHLLPKQTKAIEFWTSDKGSFIGNVTCRFMNK